MPPESQLVEACAALVAQHGDRVLVGGGRHGGRRRTWRLHRACTARRGHRVRRRQGREGQHDEMRSDRKG
eukprot:scaffold118452_cov75-Phaeocystis_antarctica.AAC.1